MTDNEIIKALEYCRRTDRYVICNSDCPMYEYCESDEEGEMNICGLALNLINCQKAEIEMLQEQIESQQMENAALANELLDIKNDAIKIFAERLKPSNKERYISYAKVERLVKEMTKGERKWIMENGKRKAADERDERYGGQSRHRLRTGRNG